MTSSQPIPIEPRSTAEPSPPPGGPQVRFRGDRFLGLLLGGLSVAAAFAGWVLLARSGVVSDILLPRPEELIDRYQQQSSHLLRHIWLTLERSVIGFSVGSSIGILVAILTSWNRLLEVLTEPLIQLFKPVPALVLVPFAIIWFGAGQGGILSLAIWGCFFLMVVEAREALRNTPVIHRRAAATLGASSWDIHARVMLPAAVPHLIGALRVNMIVAVNLVILGEFKVASGGLGDVIVRGYRFLQPDLLFFGVIVTVLLALVLDNIVRMLHLLVRKWA